MFCLIFSLFSFNKYKNTGNVQAFTAPSSTTYKLEVWGAQGGASFGATGGKGGYSNGVISINTNNNLYICIGQYTGDVGSTYDKSGISAYNGGGKGSSSGGGATHIAKANRGELKNYSSYKSEVYIVAGGGGGGADSGWGTGTGGAGGGTSGGIGTDYSTVTQRATGGSQTGPGVNGRYSNQSYTVVNTPGFGQGGGANSSGNHGGGGGGGWYGGGGYPWAGSGAGGSGYIGGVSNGTMQNGVQSGNGKAVISWHPAL